MKKRKKHQRTLKSGKKIKVKAIKAHANRPKGKDTDKLQKEFKKKVRRELQGK